MSLSDRAPCDEENSLIDRDTLARKIDDVLGGGADAADVLVSLFVELRQGIEGGLRGINRTHAALSLAVELAYTRSRTHASALRLYSLSHEGLLLVEDEPLALLDAAVARTEARQTKTARARTSYSKRR